MSSQIDSKRTGTRRERRIERKRSEIMAAAAQVFAQKGYAGTTTKDIAEAADLGESTLYNYFESKRDIFIAIIGQKMIAIDDLLKAGKPEDPRGMVELLDKAFEIALSKSQYTRSLLAEAWLDDDLLENFLEARLRRIVQVLQDYIAEGITAGTFRPLDPALGARILVGMFFGIILPILRGKEPPPTPEERRSKAESMIALLLYGLYTR